MLEKKFRVVFKKNNFNSKNNMKRSAEWSDDRESKKQLIERVHTPWRKIEQSELNLTDTCDVSPLGAIYFIDDTHANFPNRKSVV